MSQVDRDRLFELIVQWDEMRDRGDPVSPEELCPDDPELQDALRLRIAERLKIERLISTPSSVAEVQPKSPHGNGAIAEDQNQGSETGRPEKIGRYRVERLLGAGGFGQVFLAYDEDLHRHVAIKIPHAELLRHAEYIETYRREARSVAGLDHPNIVPVYDVGSSEQHPCFIVSKYIAGTNLFVRMNQSRLAFNDVVMIIATIAETLHYTHVLGLVHRDIKPVNILLSTSGEPFLVDFGLALNERDAIDGRRFAGTPAYMSPEQARGEAHRVDGRSDTFSLGVVFYELLTQQKPLRGKSDSDLLSQIVSVAPKPPCQIDETIPEELERVCLKAISKRANDRYQTALDLALDLRTFLKAHAVSASQDQTSNGRDSAKIKIIPKGLRSYDAYDADFFLQLLPGPRDRNGLPDSIRFWKDRIEATNPDDAFTVGLIYGPSGCGKSSLVKAGLIPRLSNRTLVLYLESTPDGTEARLLNGLRKNCPELPEDISLAQTIAQLRRGQEILEGQNILIVLDQFEQWLHSNHGSQRTQLVQALRQCDGGRVRAILLVRDDFWLAVSRFMKDLEIRLIEGQNSALVDLFELDHAKNVAEWFGRAYGKLPEQLDEVTKEQREFLDQAVKELADQNRIIPVQLSLFAEMMRSKPWSPAALTSMGGMEGIGVSFLEETFSAASAPPLHRYHEKAIVGVLESLLPEMETAIRGNMRSYTTLRDASGYANRLQEFEELLHILDGDLRLITPVDLEELDVDHRSHSQPDSRHYQLTHDYLVPSLRTWLARRRNETRQGRAELLMRERSSVWNARPGQRHLPGPLEWLRIMTSTRHRDWTAPQQRMMRAARQYYSMRSAVAGLLLLLVAVAGIAIRSHIIEHERQTEAQGLVRAVIDAEIGRVPELLDAMAASRKWVDPLLREAIENATLNSRQRLNTSLALLRVDSEMTDSVYRHLLEANPDDVAILCTELSPHRSQVLQSLWGLIKSTEKDRSGQRLRAASALALFDPDSEDWQAISSALAEQLVNENSFALKVWNETLRPVRSKLLSPLANIYRDRSRSEMERTVATTFLADYATDQPGLLADLVMDGDEKQFAVIFPKLLDQVDRTAPFLERVVQLSILEANEDHKESLAKRQANAAVALLKINRATKVWPVLKHSSDPRARSYLIHRFAPLGVDPQMLIARLESESDITIRRALYLSLGEFDEQVLPFETRLRLIPKLREIFRTDADPGLHAATEWLLRQWKDDAWLKQATAELLLDTERRKSQLESVGSALSGSESSKAYAWYINSQGQTLIAVPGPNEFMMGSDEVDTSPISKERRHRRRIGRSFSISTTPVTLGQYRQFSGDYGEEFAADWVRSPDLPVIGLSWFMGALYCNWLNEREGIPADQACFSIRGRVLTLRKDYLTLTGYRFPTEAEMEYATRAGSTTARYFGETEELLRHYAWYQANSQQKFWPVAMLKPNDFGLFDSHGNVYTWCQGSYQLYPEGEVVEDTFEDLASDNATTRALRGGAFIDRPPLVRSALRNADLPVARNHSFGFRIARTLPQARTESSPEQSAEDGK